MAAVTQQQFDMFSERTEKSLDEIKALLHASDERVRKMEAQLPLTGREISSLKSHEKAMQAELALQGRALALLENTVKQQASTVTTLSNALPEMAHFVRSVNGWIKWGGGIAAVLIGAGLLFFFGRLIWLSITGTLP